MIEVVEVVEVVKVVEEGPTCINHLCRCAMNHDSTCNEISSTQRHPLLDHLDDLDDLDHL